MGHLVDSRGIRQLEKKVASVQSFVQPKSRRNLHIFLSLVNFYHRFIPNCAQIFQPLNSLLSNSSDKTIVWTQPTTKAFSDIKHVLAHTTLLFHPKLDVLTCIMTDASSVAVGTVLQRSIDDHCCPIGFFLQNLNQ